ARAAGLYMSCQSFARNRRERSQSSPLVRIDSSYPPTSITADLRKILLQPKRNLGLRMYRGPHSCGMCAARQRSAKESWTPSLRKPPAPATSTFCMGSARLTNHEGSAMQSASSEATSSHLAERNAVLRAAARPRFLSCRITLTLGYLCAISTELSDDPSSITRISIGASVCA